MNATLLCVSAVLAAEAAPAGQSVIYQPQAARFAAAIRGQTPDATYDYDGAPQLGQPGTGGPTYGDSYVQPNGSVYGQQNDYGSTWVQPGTTPSGVYAPYSDPFGSGGLTYDPFLGGGTAPPGAAGPSGMGVVGPRPYRYGHSHRIDVGWLPAEDIEGTASEIEIFEVDFEHRHTAPTQFGWIYSHAFQFDYRNYDEVVGLFPSDVYRFGWDFEVSTPVGAPYSVVLGFTPAFATDFQDNMTSNAWQWDGRGYIVHRTSPQWAWVGGLLFWDRVDDRILPYAGAIWTPNDYLELRLLFPEGRISKFLGTPWGVATWLYVRGEYHVESYEFEDTGFKDQYEISDWRLVLGLRTENPTGVAAFIEGGWVFERELEFRTVGEFDIDSGAILRGGLRF